MNPPDSQEQLDAEALASLEAEMRALKPVDLAQAKTPEQREQIYRSKIESLQQGNRDLRSRFGTLKKKVEEQRKALAILNGEVANLKPQATNGSKSNRRYYAMRSAFRIYWHLLSLEWTNGSYAHGAVATRRDMVWDRYAIDGLVQCIHCGARVPKALFTVEHLKPVLLGGGDEIENLRPSCGPCNWRRPVEDISEPTIHEREEEHSEAPA